MSIYDLQSGKRYVCNLCGDECEADGLPKWWVEIKNQRTKTLQHLCESCTDGAMASTLLMKIEMDQPCPPPHTS